MAEPSVSALNSRLGEADAAIAAGEYATAKIAAVRAQVMLAGIPESALEGSRIVYADRIDKLLSSINELNELASAASGQIQRTTVEYLPVSS